VRIISGIVRIYSILVRMNIHILQPLSPRPQLLRRGTTISRTPLVAASDAHVLLTYPRAQAGFSSVPTPSCHRCTHSTRSYIRAARYRRTSLADRHIQDTAAHDPGDQFRVPWPRKYHHTRTSVGCCRGIRASACQRRAHESATQPCCKPEPPSANPNPTGLRDSTSGRPRVGAGAVVPYPVTHRPCLVPMLGPGHAETPTKTLPVIGPR